jgi:membrane protein implicated in regulation of membrane protease activity
MQWHKDMLRGFRDNAAYEGGRYLILAILAAVWPTINGIMHVFWDKPWYWKLNGLLIAITAILFVVALWKLARIGKSQPHGMQPGGDHQWRAPQPIVIAC